MTVKVSLNNFDIFLFASNWLQKTITFRKKKFYSEKSKSIFCDKTNERNWVFDTNSNFPIPKSVQPLSVNLWYFKLILVDPTGFKFWHIKGVQDWVAKINGLKNLSFGQKLNFLPKIHWNKLSSEQIKIYVLLTNYFVLKQAYPFLSCLYNFKVGWRIPTTSNIIIIK